MPWLTSNICEKNPFLGHGGFSWRFSVDQYPRGSYPHSWLPTKMTTNLVAPQKITTFFSNGNGLRLGQRHFRCSHSVDNLAKMRESYPPVVRGKNSNASKCGVWLVVFLYLVGGFNLLEKYARQNENLPQVGVKKKHIWNQHLVIFRVLKSIPQNLSVKPADHPSRFQPLSPAACGW